MPRMLLEGLKKLDAAIARAESWALIAILTVMMVVAFTQVFLRNFFSTALSWGDGLTRALVLWAGFLGASLAVKQGRFINIDAFSRLLGPRSKRVSRIITYVFSIIVCIFLGNAGASFVRMEFQSGGEYSIGVAGWIIELVIPITFYFIAFRFSLKTLCLFAGEEMEKAEWER